MEYKNLWEWHPYVPQIYLRRIRYVEILCENKYVEANYFLGRKAELETIVHQGCVAPTGGLMVVPTSYCTLPTNPHSRCS